MDFQNINVRNILKEAVRVGGIIVDVRPKEEFLRGHIPMAINIPLEDIENGYYNLTKNSTILVYCENGGGSTMAARILSEKGYKVINAVGGLSKYQGALTVKGRNR